MFMWIPRRSARTEDFPLQHEVTAVASHVGFVNAFVLEPFALVQGCFAAADCSETPDSPACAGLR